MKASDAKKLLSKSYDPKQSSIGDYELDRELSGQRLQVYRNKVDGKVYVAHRGTKGFPDVLSDLKLAFGSTKNKRFRHAREVMNKVERKYPNTPIISLGHSLGARINQDINKGRNTEMVINLNKPTVPKDYFYGTKKADNQVDVRTERDPVSFLHGIETKNGKEITIKSRSKSLLKEHKVETLGRLGEQEIGLNNNQPRISQARASQEQIQTDINEQRHMAKQRALQEQSQTEAEEQRVRGRGITSSFDKYDTKTLLAMLEEYAEHHKIKVSKRMQRKTLLKKISAVFECDDDDNLFVKE